LTRVFGGEGNRGLGGELTYLTPLPWYVEVGASITDAHGEGTNRSFFGADEEHPIQSPLDFESTVTLKQFFDLTANTSLMWGLSFASGPNSLGDDTRSNIVGTDLYWKYRPITYGSYTTIALQAEGYYRRRTLPGDALGDYGAYAYLSWRFARRWGMGARYEYGAAATNAAGVTGADPLDPEWTGGRHRATAQLTFWPTEFSRVRAQAALDAPAWRDDPVVAAFLAMEFAVGAHAAHKF
jgi:hypothetical protein